MSALRLPLRMEDGSIVDADGKPVGTPYSNRVAAREEIVRRVNAFDDLLDELKCWRAQHGCGCGHPACKRCQDDATCDDIIAKAEAR